jgi:hypothetical protein
MTSDADKKLAVDNLIALRRSMVDLYVNEANGIWQRFNFFVVAEAGFLAGGITVFNGDGHYAILSAFIASLGIWFTLGAIKSLDRLWDWHGAYFDQAVGLERKVAEFAEANGLSVLMSLPLAEMKDQSLVNKLRSNVSLEQNWLSRALTVALEAEILLFFGSAKKEEVTKYLAKRPTHQLLGVFLVAWGALIVASLVRFVAASYW